MVSYMRLISKHNRGLFYFFASPVKTRWPFEENCQLLWICLLFSGIVLVIRYGFLHAIERIFQVKI